MSYNQQHFALVPSGSQPLQIPESTENKKIRAELIDLYESYADMYPNPRLIAEFRQRDMLLQAASAAGNYSKSQTTNARSKKKVGFFRRLFGGGEGGNDDKVEDEDPGKETREASSSDPLLYTDLPNEQDDGSMCGTSQSLDSSCIPVEAYSVARFHLSSTSQRREHPNTIRWGPQAPQCCFVLVGLGAIAEFMPGQPTEVSSTSDQNDLRDYAVQRESFAIHNSRGAAISANCIAVSWGFTDGITVIYRRMNFPNSNIGWEALHNLGPTQAVVENMNREGDDLFRDDGREQPGSPLLRVSDSLPLRVETGDERQPYVTTLVLSRLGGYIEVVPLPSSLWDGPVLTPDNYRRSKSPKRRRGQHYAKQVGSLPKTLAMTTLEHHIDIMCLEAFRTSVSPDTGWDRDFFPDSPPSEFVVCASGMSRHPSSVAPGVLCPSEMVTFWSISTLFSDDFDQQCEGIQFQLQTSLLEVIQADTGAAVSIFATNRIMKQWRAPRHVELRCDANRSSDVNYKLHPTEDVTRIATISATAPIVSMRFCTSTDASGPFLAILDWNGLVEILDCSVMQRIASQSLKPQEYELYRNVNNGGDPFPSLSVAVPRSFFRRTLLEESLEVSVTNLHWLSSPVTAFVDGMLPPLVFLSGRLALSLATFSIAATQFDQTQDLKASIASHSFPGNGAAFQSLGGNLSLVSRQVSTKGSILANLYLRQLDLVAIVKSLAKEMKYEEAIETSKSTSIYDQEVLAEVILECRRRLWETKRDVDSLAATLDVAYVVEQAVSICESEIIVAAIGVEKVRTICSLAITMGRNFSPTKHKVGELRSFLVKLGTYELLCSFFSTETLFIRFCKEFRRHSVVELSKGLARRGEIDALSIVLFRNRHDLKLLEILEILQAIPLSLYPDGYGHLFPLVQKGRLADTFLNTRDGDKISHLSQLPYFMGEKYGVRIVVDQSDEKLTLDSITQSRNDDNPVALISKWFVDRATNMQQFTGNVDCVVRLCELGLKCTDTCTTEDPLKMQEAPSSRLFATWRSSIALQRMVIDGIVTFEAKGSDTRLSSISTNELLSMDWLDLVELVLGGQNTTDDLILRCRNFLHPLAMDAALQRERGEIRTLDDAVALYCKQLVQQCLSKSDGKFRAVKAALSCCAAVAKTSRTSIPKEKRLLRSKSKLIDTVFDAASGTFESLRFCNIAHNESQVVIELLWSMYETLPAYTPSSMSGSDSWLLKMGKVQNLLQDLICVDILSRWPGCRPFDLVVLRQAERASSDPQESVLGNTAVARICASFCARVKSLGTNELASLLLDLLSDVLRLNEDSFNESCDLPGLLVIHLVQPLLHCSEFRLLADYLSSDPRLVDRETVKQSVLAYVDNAIFSEDGEYSNIVTAVQCQDVIGPSFPDMQEGFATIRRYLDAAQFIDTVIYDGKGSEPTRPFELRRALPLDVVESILEAVPGSVVCGCTQWADRDFARNANMILRATLDAENGSEDETTSAHPVLPAGAIFHLATILGLDSELAALAVKCRVIHYAVKNGYQGAAAAVCRGIVNDGEQDTLGDDPVALAKLGAVATIVCNDAYNDLPTRRELCQTALSRCHSSFSACNSSAFSAITQVSAVLDHRSSRFSRDAQDLSVDRHQTLLKRPIARLYRHISSEYQADVHALCSDLLGQTSNASVHDNLMNALSRFTIYWCISYSKTLKQWRDPIDKKDFLECLALATSLLLHIPSKETADKCVGELQKIASDQADSVSTGVRFGDDDDFLIPTLQFVRKLVGRGYSENAAQRAVIMTGNRGYNEALGWAVAHTMDEDFNDPVMIFKMPGRKFIDDTLIKALHNSLFAVGRFIRSPSELAAFSIQVASMREKGCLPGEPKINTNMQATADEEKPKSVTRSLLIETKTTKTASPEKTKDRKTDVPPNFTPPHPTLPVAPSKLQTNANGSDTCGKLIKPEIPPTVPNQGTTASQKIPPAPTGFHVPDGTLDGNSLIRSQPGKSLPNGRSLESSIILPPKSLSTSRRSVGDRLEVSGTGSGQKGRKPVRNAIESKKVHVRPRSTLTVVHPANGSRTRPKSKLKLDTSQLVDGARPSQLFSPSGLSPFNADDREELRKRGKLALTKLRTIGSPSNDRQRLIEEGRQLLRLARANETAEAPTRSSPESMSNQPPPPPRIVQNTAQCVECRIPPPPPPPPPPQPQKQAPIENPDNEGWDFDDF